MTNVKGLSYLNGNFLPLHDAKISILDRGFRYGEGLFETLRIYEGRVAFLKEHFERLKNSSKILNFDFSVDFEELTKITCELIQNSSVKNGVLNIYLSTTDEENKKMNFIVTVKDGIPYNEDIYKIGYKTIISSVKIDSSLSINSHKTLSFYPHILAKREAVQKGADDAICLNTEGFVLEGSMSNIFMIKGDTLITPPLGSGILPGITRKKILEIAPSVGLKAVEKLVKVDFLKSSDEIFLTTSLMEVMPVVSVDDVLINKEKVGYYSVLLRKKYRDLVNPVRDRLP